MSGSERLALALSYNGSQYHGWQSQNALVTVQSCLENALSEVADHPVSVICAGRTDAGVHATEQVVHFDTSSHRSSYAWMMGTNRYLPADISVKWVQEVSSTFHARYSAFSRTYRYLIINNRSRPGLLSNAITWHYRPLEAEKMEEAAQDWIGTHDFSAFRGANCQSKTPIRNLYSLTVKRQGEMLVIEIKANAFLHHMVRNMVGVLLEIGAGLRPVSWAKEVLSLLDRTKAGIMAPAEGLYLVKVGYPLEFGLPETPSGPFFLG